MFVRSLRQMCPRSSDLLFDFSGTLEHSVCIAESSAGEVSDLFDVCFGDGLDWRNILDLFNLAFFGAALQGWRLFFEQSAIRFWRTRPATLTAWSLRSMS